MEPKVALDRPINIVRSVILIFDLSEEQIQSMPEEDQDLMRTMGFAGFDTTKVSLSSDDTNTCGLNL